MKSATVFAILALFFFPEYSGGLSWPYVALFNANPYQQCSRSAPPPVCPNENVTFYFYKRNGPPEGVLVTTDRVDSLINAGFDPRKPVKILIHGYTGNKDFDPNPQVRPAYLNAGDYNVFSVDWSPLAAEPCYFYAAKSAPVVGKCSGALVDTIAAAGVPPKDVHIVGFSLGSHVAGHTSRGAKVGRVGRITGLDPALPLFASAFDQPVLDASDADFVDIIHTNALNKGKLGPGGHVDFYVNGGFMQPGCEPPHAIDKHSCSHARAPELFAESISSKEGFWGFSCPNWFDRLLGRCGGGNRGEQKLMGEYVDRDARGMYFVMTKQEAPFALGKR